MKNKTPSRPMLEYNYAAAGRNLFMVAAFTAINLILLVTKVDRYFLFSASIPYLLTFLSMFFCGMMPTEYYEGMGLMEFFPAELFYVALVISILTVALYVLCGLLSKKHRVGWLIVALILFAMDTLTMVLYYGIDMSMIIDVVFHVWVLSILIRGVAAHFKLKKMPPEEIVVEATEVVEETEAVEPAEIAEQGSEE